MQHGNVFTIRCVNNSFCITAGEKHLPTAAVIDSRTVKTSDVRGFSAGKKIPGGKRHIVVDTEGMVLAVVVQATDDQHGGW
ncbi:hypothetical protein CA54_38690 [Symmachiella macrocystis]|uniref:Transposase IS4-like domain-containing protein n=1 Tax=Symmachiella macrocystis TaxID=2527985 RepID=A0A5C6B8P4_9PLAN|nr:transposase [Symmachiella macrocystis]TWU08635.1 hypothetical protein CA54_38690 [Symmachiella macrocystis]